MRERSQTKTPANERLLLLSVLRVYVCLFLQVFDNVFLIFAAFFFFSRTICHYFCVSCFDLLPFMYFIICIQSTSFVCPFSLLFFHILLVFYYILINSW